MNFLKKLGKTKTEADSQFAAAIKKITTYKPKDLSIYEAAFTHRSTQKTDGEGNIISYERLEFLGDAVLGTVIAEHLYREVPHGDEGYLTKMRSKIVSREHLNELGKDLNLLAQVRAQVPANNFGNNVHGNLFEALLGAIYLDRGYDVCCKFIYKAVINPYVDIAKLEGKVISYKSLFIEWCQKEKRRYKFNTSEDEGNESVKYFKVTLTLDKKVVAKARATSKKKAEEKAAKRAYFALQHKMDR